MKAHNDNDKVQRYFQALCEAQRGLQLTNEEFCLGMLTFFQEIDDKDPYAMDILIGTWQSIRRESAT